MTNDIINESTLSSILIKYMLLHINISAKLLIFLLSAWHHSGTKGGYRSAWVERR